MSLINTTRLILIVLLLASCSGTPVQPDKKPPRIKETSSSFSPQKLEAAKTTLLQGNILQGIRQYEQALATANNIDKSIAYLSLAEILHDKGYYQLARQYFYKINADLLPHSQKDRYLILQAANALFDENPEQAIALLQQTSDFFSKKTMQRKLLVQIQAYQQLHLPLDEVKARVALNPLLKDSNNKQDNEQKIWKLFSNLPLSDLFIEQNNLANEFQAWLQYALMIRQNDPHQHSINDLTQTWLNGHINHSAFDFIAQLGKKLEQQNRPPKKIALILPMSGKYQAISSAILDGFFIAYYQHIQKYPRETSDITLYDSAKAGSNIWPLINRIKQDQPDIIIGPLQKHYVNQIARSSSLPIPVLSLNFSERQNNQATANLIEFGLYPEDEAKQIADYTSEHGLKNAIAIIPKTRFGQRMLITYQQRLQDNGGTLLDYEQYSRKQKDVSILIKHLMGIDKSYRRYRKLRVQTGEKFDFEPRIRQDVNAIFLIANNKQAKLINPQFRFFQSGNLPVFSSSLIYDARQSNNKDLNKIRFVNLPWFFADYFPNEKQALAKARVNYNKANGKFYALGMDSYNILSKLAQFRLNPDFHYQGATGTLFLQNNGQIHRTLKWAIFEYGTMRAVNEEQDLVSLEQK